MNIFKGALYSAGFTAAIIAGCFWFYDDGSDGAGDGNSVSAETMISELSAGSGLTTLPISKLESSEPDCVTVSFSFLGDCILASNDGDTREDSFNAYAAAKDPGYFFEKAFPYYSESDFVVANSEFVLSDRSLTKQSKEAPAFWFKAPSDRADIIKAAGIDIVSIANNHTYDYGEEGYIDTKAALDERDILWGDLNDPIYVKKNGKTFGIICTSMFSANYEPMVTPVIEEVCANSDIQILIFHGGEEGNHQPEEWLTNSCHKFVDMGIDLVVGSHPHVLRPMEEYNGTSIVYSLGNFCYGGNRSPENRTVILTQNFTFDEDGNYIGSDSVFTPFYVYTGDHNNWQPAPIEDSEEYCKTLAFMYGGTDLPQ